MLAIRSILHPTDFSERSQAALGLARDYGARLIVLHVVERPPLIAGEAILPPAPEDMRAAAQAQLGRLQVPAANAGAERRLEEGDTVPEILRVAQEVHA